MFHLFFMIISYGALLLLRMPATSDGIVSTVVAFAIGSCWIAAKKPVKAASQKNRQFLFLLASVCLCMVFGLIFYQRWLPSSKIRVIADVLHVSVSMFLWIVSLILSGLSVYIIYVVFQLIANTFFDRKFQEQIEHFIE